jgi:2-polyprenyl-6-methoxyphenol hydroxylase-like FAD-dependent oxidoreductase
MKSCDVLIVGAGPTGLVLALWLARMGVNIRLIDKTTEPGTTSRALAVHARTLELYRQLDLSDTVVARGHTVPGVNLWVKGEKKARIDFSAVGHDLTPYPFLHIFPQDEHERLLIEKLSGRGVEIERRTELISYRDGGRGAIAELSGPNGTEVCETRFIAGCDGARSKVREIMATGFRGGTYDQIFYVADIEASGEALDGELHVDLDEADFLALFPLKGQGRGRLIGTVRDERAAHPESLNFGDVSQGAIEHMRIEVKRVNWFSTYRVHHRVTEHFRKGPAFVLGDAAHIHSPVGGQGMNTGIGDAINLAWKLAAVLRGDAGESLLDTYEIERIAFARRLVATTDRVFSFVSADGPVADVLRTRVAPVVLPALGSFESVREWMFRTVSQTLIEYRDSKLSEGRAGKVHGGDRLPWVVVGGANNYASLAATVWQLHVYGVADAAIGHWADVKGVPLNVFVWDDAHHQAGLTRDAIYLLRPDSYVAFTSTKQDPGALDHYLSERALSLGEHREQHYP